MHASFHQLRRALLDKEYAHLNDMQRTAVFSTGAPLLILAGAGSGKTTTIVNKISYLIRFGSAYETKRSHVSEEDVAFLQACAKDSALKNDPRYQALMSEEPISPYHILAITFTNAAAREMRERLEGRFGISTTDLWALTFHSLSVRLLRRYMSVLNRSSEFTIYDESDSLKLIERCIKELNLDERYKPKLCRSIISRAKTEYVSAEEFAQKSKAPLYPRLADVYCLYQSELEKANALDFDDLIFYAVKLLSEHPDVRREVNRRFRYVLVDEYQDTNALQYRLVSLLTSEGRICVVGDDDQSIYRFMGADIDNILSFEKSFPNAKTIRLEQNYRSTQIILDAANNVISHNENRKPKRLWTDAAGGNKITYSQLSSSQEEGDYMARRILSGRSDGKKYADFCILYRTHSQSHSIEIALKGSGIPYRIFGGLAFFKRKEIQDTLAYLNVSLNPNDRTRLLRIINEPKRGIGDTTLMRVADISSAHSVPFFDVIRHADEYPDLARSAEKLMKFAHLIEDLGEKARTLTVSEFYNYMLEETGYKTLLDGYDRNERRAREENLEELYNTIVEFETKAENPTLQAFLEETALVSAVDALDENEDAVTLMTMHCAKGLEFDTVFIPGFEEGLFPSSLSLDEENGIEEERRLCYVAITRAKTKLYLLSTRMRMIYGMNRPAAPSRFLEEIPKTLIEEQARPTLSQNGSFAFNRTERPMTKPRSTGFGYTPPPKAPTPAASASAYKVGQKVRHKTFGDGEIIGITPMSSDTMVEVRFGPAVGTKKLMTNYARLEVL